MELSSPGVRWRRLSLRAKAVAVLLPLLLSLIAAGVALVQAQAAVRQATNDVLAVTEVRRDAAEAARLMIEAESAVRGYLVDGEPLFQERYDEVASQVLPLLEQTSQVARDAEVQRRVALAVTLARQELDHLRTLRESGRSLPRPALLASLLASNQRMDALRRVLSDFDDREQQLLDLRLEAVHETRARQTWAVTATLTLGLAAGFIGTMLLVGTTTTRLRAMTGARMLDVDVEGDEIDQLQAAILAAEREARCSAEAVQGARDTFQRLLSASPVVALEGPVAGPCFTWVSDNCERIFGWSGELLLDDPEWRRRLTAPHAEAGPLGHAVHEDVLVDGDGTARTVLVTRVEDSEHVTVYLLDLTAQRAAEAASAAASRTVEDLLEAAPDIVTLLDAKGHIERTTMTTRTATRRVEADMLGVDPADLVLEEDRALMRAGIRALLVGEVQSTQARHRVWTRDGAVRWQESYGRRMEHADGSVRGIAVVTRDVTAQVEAEEELRRARLAAEEANHAKTEFLSRMSHELRTPLNAILGFAQLLARSELDEDDQESVAHVLHAGRHLLNLINDVLDIAQVESGKAAMSMEPVDVASTVAGARDLVRPLAEERGVQVVVGGDEGCLVLGDHQRLAQVLINLMSNAVKYNARGGRVGVTWQRVAGGRVGILVTDDGPGIAPELMGRVFVPFDRMGAEATDVEGTGVGLPLSKQLVEAMHGHLGVESTVGIGTTFTVVLPEGAGLATTPGAIPAPSAPAEPEARPATVLYIEDNPVNLALVRKMLRARPQVHLLSEMRGDRGLEAARRELPDLVLLDQHLPGLSGTEVLDALKSDPRTAGLPVVVISAEAHDPAIEAMLSAGALRYLTKPIDVDDLLEVVDAALELDPAATS